MGSPLIHCIHDEARTDRLALLEKEIAVQKLNVQFWPAVKDLVMGFRGISRAHKQIIHWAMWKNLPEVLIMEDDCYFFAPGAFEYYLSQKPVDYDLYLGNVFSGLQPDGTAPDFCGLTLYFCHSRFYKTFLSMPEENHIDRALSLRAKGRYVVCDPMVCSQQAGYSDNKKTVSSYDHYLEGYRLFGKNSY
jgi:hypothetical protein